MPRSTRVQRWKTKWRRLPPWGKVTAATAVIIGLTGSATGMRAAMPLLKPVAPALIYYVDDSVGEVERKLTVAQQSTNSILRDLQIEANEGKKSSVNNSLANWKLEKLKTNDPVTRGLIDQQIQQQENELEKLNSQLKTLNKLRQQGQ